MTFRSKADLHEYELLSNEDDLPESDQVLCLSDLAEKYSQSVPFRFRVVNGFMAENERDPTLGVDEVYSVHLVRELKVVVVQHKKEEFEIPLNSSAKFVLNHEGAASSSTTVEDMLSSKHLPKVIAVKGNPNPDPDFCLKMKDVLLVKEVVKGKIGNKAALRVFSVSSRKELVLPKYCDTLFSTAPEDTQLYLTELLDNGIEYDFLPSPAKIFPGEDSSLAGLRSDTITITQQRVHRSVIISLFRDNPNSKQIEEPTFIDVPTTINIRLSVIKTTKSDEIYKRIYNQSVHFLTNFNPSKIQACVDAHSDAQYLTQAQLLAEIRKEKATREMTSSAPQQFQQLLNVKESEKSYELVTAGVSKPKSKHTVASIPSKPTQQLKPPPPPLPSKPTQQLKPPTPPLPPREDCDLVFPAASTKGNTEKGPVKSPVLKKADITKQAVLKYMKKPPPPLPPKQSADSSQPSKSDGNHKPTENWMAHNDNPPTNSLRSAFPAPQEASSPQNAWPKPQVETNLQKQRERARVPSSDIDCTRVLGPDLEDPAHYVKYGKASPLDTHGESDGQLHAIQKTLSAIMSQIIEINKRQSVFERELSSLKISQDAEESNVVTTSMSPADVQKALDTVGLPQYKESFAREAVDGEVFMFLDEDILCHELGVNSRLHRVRLMKMKQQW